jgi:hypothetical protein
MVPIFLRASAARIGPAATRRIGSAAHLGLVAYPCWIADVSPSGEYR